MKRAENFDAILVETTGLADPAPVAQTFFVDEDVAAKTRLDAIVTIVDARHLEKQLEESHEAAEQLAFADLVLLNKIDLAGAEDLARIEDRIRAINPYARIVHAERCGVPLDTVLGQNAFDLKRVLEIEPHFLEGDHAHTHDDDVTSVSLRSDIPLDGEAFQKWFGQLLREKGQDILRSKGILDIKGEPNRYVIQGVHMLMEGDLMGPWPEGEDRRSRLVFIGRGLDGMALEEGFAACKAA